jgi:hypothetical protein
MSWSQQDLSFKKLSNKRVTTSTGKGLPEEKGASALELYLPDIKTELIPGTGNTATGLNGVLYYYGPSASFGQTLVVDTSVPGNLTWFASSGYGNTTTANDGSAGSESLRLFNWVSDKYDAFGTVSGAGYEIKLYDNAGNLITKSDASNWLFDYQTGILMFNNATLSNGNPVSTSGPYKIVGWRYVGQKGTIPAYFGGSGYTTYTKGDILVGAGGTFIKFNVGSDNYILSADSSTDTGLKWVVNTGGGGSGISYLNNLTAGVQYFAVGTSGSLFNISSIGSTHTFNIPIAGSGATGLVSTDAQTFAGQKTFTSAIIGDLTGTATTAGFATTANYSNQSGYAITSGLATTATYAHQSGYGITAGLATTATYAHQSGYASTAGIANSSYSSFINSSNSNLSHPLIFAPITGSSSGAGLSLNTVLNYNPSSNILYTSGLAITATTASSSTSTGALTVAGGVGISGRLSFNQASFGTTGISSNPTIAMIGTTGDPIYLSVLEDNTISFEGSQGQLFSITPNLSTGYIYSVNDITGIPLIRANANANVTANEYAGNFGIGATNPGYKLHVIGSVGFTSVISSTSTSTGTLVVSGGVGIGGSLNVNSASSISNVIINNGIIYGNLTGTATTAGFATTAGLATTATYAHQSGYAITSGSSSTATTATYAHQSGYAITSGSSDTSGLATTATYAHQSGYAITSGLATTATYSHQSGYAITSGSSALATTATYAHQSGYAITSGLATTATYAHQSGYAITSGSSSTATTATYAHQSGYATTSGSSNTSGYATTSGLATTSQNVNIVSANTGTFYPLFTSNSSTSSGAAVSIDGSDISYNFATNTLTAGTFSGNVSATAVTATNIYGTLVGNLTGSATTSQNVNIVSATTGTFYPLFSNTSSTASGIGISVDNAISYDASTDTLTAGKFSGLASGTAATFTNFYGSLTGLATTATIAQGVLSSITGQAIDLNIGLISGTALSYNSNLYYNPASGRLAAVSYTGSWAGSLITGLYGGTGYTAYTKGDILVGAGGTFIKLGVGSDNTVLTASSSSATGLTWSPTANTGITTLNTLTAATQFFSTGTSGSAFNISSSGSTHTFNIPIAGTGATGLVSTLAQTFAGAKTFTGDVVITSSTASTYMASGALTVNGGVGISGQLSVNQVAMGYTGIATNPVMSFIGSTNAAPITMTVLSDGSLLYEGSSGKLFGINNNLSSGWIFNVGDVSGLPIIRANADGTIAMAEFAGNVGIGLSNPSYKLHVAGDTNLSSTYVYRINGTSVLSSTQVLGLTVNSGNITSGTWSGTAISVPSGGTGLTTYTVGDILYASGSATIGRLTAGTAGSILISAGTGATPYYSNPALFVSGNATTAANINIVSATTGTFYPLFSNTSSTASGIAVSVDSGISYDAATDTLTAGKFSGLASGTAATYTNIYGTLSGFATTATNVNSVSTTATNATHYLMFSPVNGGSGVALSSGVGVTFNPSSGQLGLGTGSALINGLLLGTSSNTITTASGNLTLNASGGTVLVAGNFNVQGTATYIDSTTQTITDPVIVLGSGAGGTHTNVTDTQDRGIEFRRFSGSAITGFFGLSNASGRFTFIPNANVTANNTYTGSIGVIEANITGSAITATNFYGTFVGNAASATTAGLATTAQNLNITTTATGTLYPLFTSASTTASGVAVSVDGTDISYDAATNTLTAGKFSGLASGTAATFTNIYGPLTGTATTAQNLNVVSSTSGTFYPLFTNISSTASGVAVSVDSGISWDSATDTLTAGKFSGLASGSAATFTNFYGTLTGNVTGTSTTSQNVNIVSATTGTFYPLFSNISTTASGVAISVDSGLSWNSATDTLTSGTFSGNLSATAATATNFYGTFVGSATTSTSLSVVLAATNASHQVLFTPTSGTASGVAVSTENSFVYNPSTDVLSVSGLAVTASTTSTNSSTGALIVTGGMGIGGTVYTATDLNVGTSTTGRLYFSQATLGSAGTTVIPSMAFIGTTNSPITLSVLADNSLSFDGSSGQLFSINNNLSTGWIFAVNDISGLPLIRANADGTVAMGEFAGNIGIGISNPSYKLHVVGDTNLSSTYVYRINGTSVLSASSLGTGVTNSSLTAVGTITTGTWAGSTITGLYGGTGYTNYTAGDILVGAGGTFIKLNAGSSNYVLTSNGSGTIPSWQAVPSSAASSVAVSPTITNSSFSITAVNSANGSGLGLSTIASFVVNPSTGIVSMSGLAVTASTTSTSSSTGALIVTGGVGIGQTLFTSSSYASSISGVVLSNGVITSGSWSGSTITAFYGGTGYNSYTKGDILVGAGSTFIKLNVGTDNYILSASSASATGLSWIANTGGGGAGTVYNGSLNAIPYYPAAGSAITGSVNFTNTGTSINIGYSTATTNTATGALTVVGGVGIGQTLFTSSSYASSISGVVLDNGIITSGTWSGSTITAKYGGTGYTTYTTGDLLVGAGSTFIKVGSGSTNYILSANSSLYPAGVGWTWVSAVVAGTNPPNDTHDSDLWWNSDDGSLNFYYNDGDTSQWVEIAGGSGIDLSQPVHITSTLGSTNVSTGALIVDGGVGVAGTVNAQSFVVNGTYDQIGTTLTTSATTANQVALTLNTSVYRSAKIFVQASSGSTYHSQEVMLLHDGSDVYMTEYAMVNSGAIGSTFDGDISGGNMRFLVTPTYAETVYKIACSAIRI